MIYTVNKNPSTAAFSLDTLGCATLFYFYNQSAPSFSESRKFPLYVQGVPYELNRIDKVIPMPIWVTVSNDLTKNRSGFIRLNKKYLLIST